MIQIDMEMPQNCKFCPLHDANPDQCPIRTIYKDDYATSRFTDCPLYKIAEDTDTISRQAVIDALQDRYKLYSWDDGGAQKAEIGRIIREIYDMSSAQPEPCGDVVSRNAIVQKLNEMDRYVSTELRLCDTDKKFPQNEVFIVDDVYEEIVEQLPSAQLEIVRCCKCGFWDRDTLRHQFNDFRDWNEAECMVLAERDPYHEMDRYTEADDYCSRAERRTDE